MKCTAMPETGCRVVPWGPLGAVISGEGQLVVRPYRRRAHAEESAPPRGEQCVEARAAGRADGIDAEGIGSVERRRVFVTKEIHLGEDHTVGLGGELLRVFADLSAKPVVAFLPIHLVDGQHEGEDSRPFYMAQELESQPLPFVRALDDARNV